jgi:hypothetical protein
MPRFALATAAFLLAHEHHSAISKLLETQHFAAARALIRPLVEAVLTTAWVIYVAPSECIEDLHFARRALPKPTVMISQLDNVQELKGKLELKLFMDGQGKILHKYTHGDMEQLGRRFSVLGTTFTLDENIGALMISDLFLLLGATLYSVTAPWTKIANRAETESNAVVDEIRERTNQPLAEWVGWKELPFPAIPLGRIPGELRSKAPINDGSAPEETK